MTKRPFPFEPSICRQSKIHLNNYENDLIALNDVKLAERTLRKLLEGPRKLHSISLCNKVDSDPIENEVQSKNTFLQKQLTNYITVNGTIVNKTGISLKSPMESASCCSFCESRTNSAYQCIHCMEFYCAGCSFALYEAFEERRICLSCS